LFITLATRKMPCGLHYGGALEDYQTVAGQLACNLQ